MTNKTYAKVFRFRGGELCLDFANTIQWPRSKRIEMLETPGRLAEWAGLAGIAQTGTAGLTERDVTRAVQLRDEVITFFTFLHGGQPIPDSLLTAFTSSINAARSRQHLRQHSSGFEWQSNTGGTLDMILDRVALSMAHVITGDQLACVKACAMCDWLFLDTSRNHSRRWCSMDSCGVHVKMRSYNERRRG